MLRIAITTLAIVLIGAVLVVFVANRAFNRSIQREVADLAAQHSAPAAPDEAALRALPAPVQRYLRFAIPAGRAPVRSARLEHGGQFRTRLDGGWMPMTAREYFFTARPAFVWNASVRMFPGLSVAVKDSYAGGMGGVDARLLGALPVAQMSGRKVDEAALQRFVAEAVWLPTALQPSPWLRWEAMDDTHARALVTDGAVSASVVFSFDDTGRITSIETERYRSPEDAQPTPWVGTFRDYRRFGDLMAPAYGEVGWKVDGQVQPYARVRVQDIRYDAP
jgi:Family of unknown function (DUF6920)